MMVFDGNGASRRRRRNINAKELKIIAKAQVLCNNPALYPSGSGGVIALFCGDAD
jgi:hypothetical protein